MPLSLWDGVVEGAEECDDANGADGDGCTSACLEEPRYQCSGEPSQCACETYLSGPNCDVCTIYVRSDASGGNGQSWASA